MFVVFSAKRPSFALWEACILSLIFSAMADGSALPFVWYLLHVSCQYECQDKHHWSLLVGDEDGEESIDRTLDDGIVWDPLLDCKREEVGCNSAHVHVELLDVLDDFVDICLGEFLDNCVVDRCREDCV